MGSLLRGGSSGRQGGAGHVRVSGQARGCGPRSPARARVAGTQRRQLEARTPRREPGPKRRALPALRVRNDAAGRIRGAGAQSRAQRGTQQGVPPARCARPGAQDLWTSSPGQLRPLERADTARLAGGISKNPEGPPLSPTAPPSQETPGPT